MLIIEVNKQDINFPSLDAVVKAVVMPGDYHLLFTHQLGDVVLRWGVVINDDGVHQIMMDMFTNDRLRESVGEPVFHDYFEGAWLINYVNMFTPIELRVV